MTEMHSRTRIAGIEAAGERPDTYLLVEQPGAFLGKHSERLQVSVKGQTLEERPLLGLEHVMILGSGISLSADAIRGCAERGIQISFVSATGTPFAKLIAPELTGTVQTRRQQLLAFTDGRGVHLAKAFAMGKLRNQASLLKYMAKYRQELNADLYEEVREAAFQLEELCRRIDLLTPAHGDVNRHVLISEAGPPVSYDANGQLVAFSESAMGGLRQEVMMLEARGARYYWDAARRLVSLPSEVGWSSRETRGASDLVNQCLNYGYGILYAQVERAVLLAGLDAYAGFLHEDRPGKPSLVLDLVEEFRAYVVDRTVFAMFNQRVALQQDATGRLDQPTRAALARRINERLETPAPHLDGRRLRLRSIIQSQSRRLGSFLRGEIPAYMPWAGRW